MPVTLHPSDTKPSTWRWPMATSAKDLLGDSCPKDFKRSGEIFHSSFPENCDRSHISPSQHGFVRSVWRAYSDHHHLTVRPEDVWFSILVQLNFYINAHAEELRSHFVAHEGQKELVVQDVGTIHSVDVGKLAIQLTEKIQENVLDPELRAWLIPAFSTTTRSDEVIAAVLMMGTLQKYFSYKMCLMCGIPTVTLLGERDDWEKLLAKLDKLRELGKEPTQFADLLGPVLQGFVMSFDDPSSPTTYNFWNRCVHHIGGGSGPVYLSGWITAFCMWDEDGKSLYNHRGLQMSGVTFPLVDTGDIPSGFASVPVLVDDNGHEIKTVMVAGLVGIEVSASEPTGDATTNDHQSTTSASLGSATVAAKLDSIRPFSAWWMFEDLGEEKENDNGE
ncbi:hypothetical protein NUU61_002354 [Penicillium alfredii]|uniref:DUF4419 domain-containing protein n=1 Tax=Penicillium alfredii TaxID=1506179 RepID=A0A9W9FS41_9EURO|nr:uncharacterized protein NUU61_002354 [Penicillium alfredii]KAJ5105007.1 hypothetical protein NUU61_002354 [Penicillium alfredii]